MKHYANKAIVGGHPPSRAWSRRCRPRKCRPVVHDDVIWWVPASHRTGFFGLARPLKKRAGTNIDWFRGTLEGFRSRFASVLTIPTRRPRATWGGRRNYHRSAPPASNGLDYERPNYNILFPGLSTVSSSEVWKIARHRPRPFAPPDATREPAGPTDYPQQAVTTVEDMFPFLGSGSLRARRRLYLANTFRWIKLVRFYCGPSVDSDEPRARSLLGGLPVASPLVCAVPAYLKKF